MKNLAKFLNLLVIVVLSVSVLSCDDSNEMEEPQTNTIADFVVANSNNYSSLLAALTKADLVDTLKGLMIGVEFNFETKPLVLKMLENGVLANATADRVLRLVPPLNIPYEDLEKAMEVLKKSLKELKDHE